jgi:hypothetical protein
MATTQRCSVCGLWSADPDRCSHVLGRFTPSTLDAAWAEAEAALPEGDRINTLCRHGDGWLVWTEGRPPGHLSDRPIAHGQGPTPAAALRALAVSLRKDTPVVG